MYRKIAVLFLTMVICIAPLASQATTTQSNVATVSLTATVPASLTVSVSPSALNFTNNNINATAIAVTTTWNLTSGAQTTLDVVAFFSSATALMGSPSGSVPTSGFIEATPGSGSCGSNVVLGGVTFANSCPLIFTVPITSTNLSGTNTTSTTWQIPTLLSAPPGSYTGTLNFQALTF